MASVSRQDATDATLSKRLVASAAACVAVDVKGRAVVELEKDAVILGRNGECYSRMKQLCENANVGKLCCRN